MLTWTTYGTWLQGDERGYVKDGRIIHPNTLLADANKKELLKEPVVLTPNHRRTIEGAIYAKADKIGQKIFALSVCSNHVHIVVDYTTKDLGLMVRYYKMAAHKALRNTGFEGRLWTKGFDKRFCFDQKSLQKRIDYVNAHNESSYRSI